jgi:hypothetical protein
MLFESTECWTDVGKGRDGMTDAERKAERIRAALPSLKRGSLRFWGQWFGRPHDNVHTLVGCTAEGVRLRLVFDENETLSVSDPGEVTADHTTLRIVDASSLRWEWFCYGRPKIAENLYFEEYLKSSRGVSATTNVDWYKPDLRPDANAPALEIV